MAFFSCFVFFPYGRSSFLVPFSFVVCSFLSFLFGCWVSCVVVVSGFVCCGVALLGVLLCCCVACAVVLLCCGGGCGVVLWWWCCCGGDGEIDACVLCCVFVIGP